LHEAVRRDGALGDGDGARSVDREIIRIASDAVDSVLSGSGRVCEGHEESTISIEGQRKARADDASSSSAGLDGLSQYSIGSLDIKHGHLRGDYTVVTGNKQIQSLAQSSKIGREAVRHFAARGDESPGKGRKVSEVAFEAVVGCCDGVIEFAVGNGRGDGPWENIEAGIVEVAWPGRCLAIAEGYHNGVCEADERLEAGTRSETFVYGR
jgi:hypothetical protein